MTQKPATAVPTPAAPIMSQKPTAAVQTKQPTIAETVKRESANDLKNWASGKGNGTPAYNTKDNAPSDRPPYPKFVQTDAQINMGTEKKEKIVTPTSQAVQAELKAADAQELLKPKTSADNSKDTEPK